jgi:hypothetical protein
MAEPTELNHLYDTLKKHSNFEYIFYVRPAKRYQATVVKRYNISDFFALQEFKKHVLLAVSIANLTIL